MVDMWKYEYIVVFFLLSYWVLMEKFGKADILHCWNLIMASYSLNISYIYKYVLVTVIFLDLRVFSNYMNGILETLFIIKMPKQVYKYVDFIII